VESLLPRTWCGEGNCVRSDRLQRQWRTLYFSEQTGAGFDGCWRSAFCVRHYRLQIHFDILTFYNYICVISFDPLGADYTRYFMCDFMCDLLHIADAIWGICDLVSDKNPSLSFFAPNRRRDLVCDSVSVLQLRRNRACTKLHEPNRTPNRTRNCMLRVIGSNSVSDNKSQMQHIAHEIAHEFLLV
jgi:hypothetical protein